MAVATQAVQKSRAYWAWRKWQALLKIAVQDGLAYKANLVIWIMTDVTTAVVMPLIWLASYNGRAQIHGYTPSQMVLYYLVMLSLTGFIESHVMWDMASDVKQGKFNVYLIRPVSYLVSTFAGNLGWRVMRTVLAVPIFALVAFAFRRYLPDLGAGHYHWGLVFWLSVILGHLVSFSITYAFGLLALWLYETRSLFNFYYLPLIIFSGQLAPISLLPATWRAGIYWLPFPYTLAFPTDVFLGKLDTGQIEGRLLMQVVWIALGLLSSWGLWRGGVRRFVAFGI